MSFLGKGFLGKIRRRKRRLAELDKDRDRAWRESVARKYRAVVGADKPIEEDLRPRDDESKYGDEED